MDVLDSRRRTTGALERPVAAVVQDLADVGALSDVPVDDLCREQVLEPVVVEIGAHRGARVPAETEGLLVEPVVPAERVVVAVAGEVRRVGRWDVGAPVVVPMERAPALRGPVVVPVERVAGGDAVVPERAAKVRPEVIRGAPVRRRHQLGEPVVREVTRRARPPVAVPEREVQVVGVAPRQRLQSPRGRHVRESAHAVAEVQVILRRVPGGVDVLDDPEIEESVAVDVDERRSGGVVELSLAADVAVCGAECEVPAILQRDLRCLRSAQVVVERGEDVEVAVVVDVAPRPQVGGPHRVDAAVHDAGRLGDVLERSVATISEEPRGTRPSIREVVRCVAGANREVGPAVAVVVDRVDARAGGHQHVFLLPGILISCTTTRWMTCHCGQAVG